MGFTPVVDIVDNEAPLKIEAHLDEERILSLLEKYPGLFKETGKLGMVPGT